MNRKSNYKIISTGKIRLLKTVSREIEDQIAWHEKEIEEIWLKAVERSGGKMFNGSMMTYAGYKLTESGVDVFGHFAGYKDFIARMERPELGLDIKPIGVSGLVVVEEDGLEYLVFGLRKTETSIYPGYYELVPAGSIEEEFTDSAGEVDFRRKVMCEFEEEIGEMPQGCITDVSGFAFIYDALSDVYDVCSRISIRGCKQLIEGMVAKSPEYQAPAIIPTAGLSAFIEENTERLVPTSIGLTKLFLSVL